MIGLDCNILVQLALADHPAHAATFSSVQSEAQQGRTFALPALVVTEFLHVITDSRRFSPPLTMSEAVGWLEAFLANPSVKLLQPTDASVRQTLLWMRQFGLGRKRILDTHLASTLHTRGIHRLLTSNSADFAVFGVLEMVTP